MEEGREAGKDGWKEMEREIKNETEGGKLCTHCCRLEAVLFVPSRSQSGREQPQRSSEIPKGQRCCTSRHGTWGPCRASTRQLLLHVSLGTGRWSQVPGDPGTPPSCFSDPRGPRPHTRRGGGSSLDRLALGTMETTCAATAFACSGEVGAGRFEEKEAVSSHVSPDLCPGRSRQVGKALVLGEVTGVRTTDTLERRKLGSPSRRLPRATRAFSSLNHVSPSSQIEGERRHGSAN